MLNTIRSKRDELSAEVDQFGQWCTHAGHWVFVSFAGQVGMGMRPGYEGICALFCK